MMDTPGTKKNVSKSAETPLKDSNEIYGETEESVSARDQGIEEARAKKASAIRKACASHDVKELIAHATSEGGLLEDRLRQVACRSIQLSYIGRKSQLIGITGPILLGCDETLSHSNIELTSERPPHAEEDQVDLDVNRSFVYYPKNGM